MRNAKIARLVIGAVAVAATMSACAQSSSSSSQNNAAAAPAVLRVGVNDQVTSLDPELGYSAAAQQMQHLISGTLFTFNPDASSSPQPGLAASATHSADDLTWTFTLRRGVKFSDGTPLSAADVVASLTRVQKDKAGIAGTRLGAATQFTAVNADTVKVVLKSPIAQLETLLSEFQYGIYPRAQLAKASFFNRPVSAGPYELSSVETNTVVLVRNPYYWGTKPAVAKVELLTVSDPNTLVTELQAGQLDFALDAPPSDLQTLRNAGGITTKLVPLYGESIMTLNNSQADLKDVRVREAISAALDRSAIVNSIYPGQSSVRPQVGYWPQTLPGYDSSGPATADAKKASSLLAGTPCATRCTLNLVYSPSFFPFASQLVLLIKQQLAAAGITVDLIPQDSATWLTNLLKGNFDMSLTVGYTFDNDTAILAQEQLTPAGGANSSFSGFSNPAADTAVNKLTTASSSSAAAAATRSVAQVYSEYMPFIPLMSFARLSASRISPHYISEQTSGLIDIGGVE
jgi:peptide/nickel transport system substrate-binding protein